MLFCAHYSCVLKSFFKGCWKSLREIFLRTRYLVRDIHGNHMLYLVRDIHGNYMLYLVRDVYGNYMLVALKSLALLFRLAQLVLCCIDIILIAWYVVTARSQYSELSLHNLLSAKRVYLPHITYKFRINVFTQ